MSNTEREMTESTEKGNPIEKDSSSNIPYLPPERMAELPPDIREHIITLQARIEALNADKKTLEELAGHDGLTGLDNRRRLDRALPREITASVRLNKPLSLIMIDIDDFKILNDLYGHTEGDGVLKKVAQAILVSTRRYDQTFRYGGEELAVLVNLDVDKANGVAERIRKAIESKGPITVSLGVAQFTPDPSLKIDDEEILQTITNGFIDKADSALYKAKGSGKNRTAFINAQGIPSVINSNTIKNSSGK